MKFSLVFVGVILFYFVAQAQQDSKAVMTSKGENFWNGEVFGSFYFYSDGSITVPNNYNLGDKDPKHIIVEYSSAKLKESDKTTAYYVEPKIFKSITSERTKNSTKYLTHTSFGPNNSIVHQMNCKEKDCYEVSLDVCNKIKQNLNLTGYEKPDEKKNVNSSAVKMALKESLNTGTMSKDFDEDKKAISNVITSLLNGKKLSDSDKIDDMNVSAYIATCMKIKAFNEIKRAATQQPAEGKGK